MKDEQFIAGLPAREYHRQWRQRNPEAVQAAQDKYRCKPENRERQRAYSRAYNKTEAHRNAQRNWYLKNAEQQKARVAEWRKNNRERYLAYKKEYLQSHLDAHRLRESSRRARKRNVTVEKFTAEELRQYWLDNGIDPDTCIYCDGPHEHDDHVVPLSRGGAHERANLVPACAKCNGSKNDKLLHEWQPERYAA